MSSGAFMRDDACVSGLKVFGRDAEGNVTEGCRKRAEMKGFRKIKGRRYEEK